LFGARLGAELTQLGTGGDGSPVKPDAGPQALKTTKEDKSASQGGNAADPSSLALLPVMAAQVAAPVNAPVLQASDVKVDSKVQSAAVQTAVAATVQSAEDTGSLIGGSVKKLGEQQKLPQAADFAQFLPLGQPLGNTGHASGSGQAVTLAVPTLMQDPAWGKAFGEQMMGMVSLKADTAHIQVNPPELGPIDVTLKIDNNNQAQVSFVTSNPMARDIVENHLPRLSSMLAAGGIQLTGSQVSTGQGNQQQAQQQQQRNQRNSLSEEGDTLAVIKAARGVLSIFA